MSGVPDYPLEETLDFKFTSRATTGVPTVLAGTPVIEIYENNDLTQITGAETLTVSFDSVVGLNNLRVVATAANGFENGKSYQATLSAGTVGGISVVGEVVQQFSIGRSAAAVDLANGTDGLTALKTAIDDVPTTAEFEARTLVAASYFDPAADDVATVTTLTNKTGFSLSTASILAIWHQAVAAIVTAGTIGKLLIDEITSARMAELDAANLPTDVANIQSDTTAILSDTAEIGTAGIGLSDLGGMSTAMKAEVNVEVDDVISTDTSAEPGQGVPAATNSLRGKIDQLYKAWRNKKEATATTVSIFDDAGTTVDQKITISDNGTTFSKGEIASGP